VSVTAGARVVVEEAAGSPRVPLLLPLVLLGGVALAGALPAAALELREPLVALAQPWRLLTCHWVHWSSDHLAWDALPLLLLGWTLRERAGRAVAALVAASLLIPVAVWALQPQIAAYRGLSGLASALFALSAVELWRRERRGGPALLLLALFAGKVLWELATATTLFADSTAHGFVPVPLAHLVGGACGTLVAIVGADRGPACEGPGARRAVTGAS
jgi:rhomboid family GlyGly-CTERM serine protease